MKNVTFSESQSDVKQNGNVEWWENHPMTYDWEDEKCTGEGTKEWFEEIDREFWDISKPFAHPNYPACTPFSRLIDYNSLADKQVLEIGCGMGSHAHELAKSGAVITAIDLTQKAVQMTQSRFELFGVDNATVQQADAERLPFPDDSFDFVWSWGVIHHSANTHCIVQEIKRVLKPGGKVAVMIYHRNSTRYYLHGLYQGICKGKFLRYRTLYAVNMTFTDGYIARHYTRRDAKQLFLGFRSVKTKVMDSAVPSICPGWGRLTRMLPKMLNPFNQWINNRWGWFLFVEAEK